MALSTRSNPIINSRRLAVLLASTAMVASPALATDYPVTDTASASTAVTNANAAAGTDTITLQNSITLGSSLPAITDSLGVNGAGFTLNSSTGNVILTVGGSAVDVAIGNDVTINGGNNQAIQVSGTGATVENLGTVRNTGTAAAGSLGAAILVAAPSGATTITNGSASDSVATIAGFNYGVINRTGNAGTLTVDNYGAISGNALGILGETGAGVVTLTNRSTGTIAGASGVQLAGAASVTNSGSITGGTGQFQRGVYFTGSGSTLTNLAGGAITAGRGIQANGSVTIANAGTITSNCAAPSFQCVAVGLFNGGTITNAVTGVINSSSRAVAGQGSATTVINNGLITSTIANDTTVILFAGGSIINNAGATIANANGYAAYIFGTSGSITNAGSITGQFGASVDSTSGTIGNSGTISGTDTGVSGFNATLGLTNSGLVSGTQFGVRSTAGALSVTNLNGGTISSTAGAGVYTQAGTLAVDNQAGATIAANSHAIRSAGTATITNAGTLTSTNADAVWSGGVLSLTNSGTITGGFAGISATAGGSIVNSGTINGSASASGFSYAVQLTGAGSITNQAGGALNGADGAIATFGSGAITIDLQAGSAANGAITSTGDGVRNLLVDGTLGGNYNASTGTGVDTVTLGQGGSMAGVSLGAGDDFFTTQGGTISAALDGGDGSDRFTASLAGGVSTSFDLAGLTAFETIAKLGLGTLTLTGASASPAATILAGDGGNDDGLVVFDGTTGLTGDIYVNGAIIRANSEGAFGTGTIHSIDPTIQYAATGTYTNDILLAVAAPASTDPTRLEALNASTATLSGAITSDPTADPDQYVTIGGDGTIVLTNTANAWTGTTTIDSGATLRGASDTISGGNIIDNGTLAYVQPLSGTVAQDISGGGQVNISGLGAGEALTFSGTNTVTNGFHVLDGSAIVLTGSNTALRNITLDGANAQVSIAATATLVSTGDVGVIGFSDGNLVDNQGSITGGTAFGVALYGGNSTLINGSASNGAALVSGDIGGASSAGSSLTVQNYGIIIGRAYNGIDGGDLNVTNYAGGQIIGQGNASQFGSVGVVAVGTLTLDNAGQIVGRYAGVQSNGAIDLTNSGLIGSGYLTGTTFSYSDGYDGVRALGGGTIDNLAGGQILGSINGIFSDNQVVTVTNAGTIHGNNSGIYANFGLTLTNDAGGSITADNGPAVFSPNIAATVTNLGSIASVNDIGVNLAAGGLLTNGSASNSTASITGGFIGVASGNALLTIDNYGLIRGTALDAINSPIVNLTNRSTGQIIADGAIGSTSGVGVTGNTVTVDNAGQIVGRYAGLRAFGTLDLTNSGLIGSGSLSGTTFSYSDGNDGIQVLGGGTIDNLAGGQILGSISGLYAANAAYSVTNAGTIHGNQYAIYSDAALTLTNVAGGSVDGTNVGLQLNANGNVITNSGSITGNEAIHSNGTVTLTNNFGGVVSGSNAAFNLAGSGAGLITNFGDLINGVVSTGGGNLTIDNRASGNIVRVVFGSAIDMSNGGRLTLTNAGDIVGSGWGVVGRNAGDSIINSGRIASGTISGNTITVSGLNAIELQLGGSVTNLAGGQITGRNSGITGGAIVVDNRSGALISGNNAVAIGANSSVTNAGTITGGAANGNSGVGVGANSAVTNLAGGTITGTRATQFSGANDILTNSGSITSTATTASQGYAVLFFNGGTANNLAGGTINGQYRGVYIAGGIGSVTNAGTIRATIDNAVSLFNGGSVNNQAGGTLTALGAGGWGIYGTGGALGITNAGTINADSGIVTNANGAIVTNSGSITGTVDGVNNLAGTSLTLSNNGGTIIATNRTGVRAEGALVLTNSGTIRSNATAIADGVTVLNGAAATITNSGTISAATASGIAVTGASTITNSGTLTGGTNATYGYGAQFAGGSSGSLVNQSGGTIGGGTGSVLLFTDNAVSIDLQQGSTANGAILSTAAGARTVNVAGALNGVYDASAGTGIDTVTLASTGSIGGALLGAGDDSFTTRGGTIGGAVNGGAGNDVLTFDIAGAATYNAGLFDAFETRSKFGVGTLTLTGTDVMATDFAVNAGTLVLSGGSALGDGAALITAAGTTTRLANANEQVRTISGAGAIDLGANALILGGNDTTTYSGVIGGTGSLAKFGTGILTLSGANTFTGLTQVSGGTLRLGTNNILANASIVSVASGATFDLAGFSDTIGGLTGAGTVALGAGRLTVDQATSTVFSGPITGTGGLTKLGTGRLDLTGASNYTGATFVNGGTLAVNGSLASVVTVNAGGTLGGNGSVGGLSILSGGILAPGNSIGHLTVAGPLSFAAGSIYQVETSPTAADSTSATGNITIGGGTVQVLATGTAYNPLTRYTILDTTSAVSGTFAAVTSNLAFLTPGLEYNPKSVVLVLRRNDIIFSAVAENPNQVAVANAIQSIGISPLYDAVLVQSAVGARQAYDALSGEVYASTQTAILGQRDRLQDAMASNRLRSDGISLWLDAGRSWGTFDQSRRGNAIASTDTNDLLGGFNWTRGSLGLTIAGGRVIDKVEIEDRASKAKAKSWLFGGQLAYGADLGIHAVVGGNYASHKVSTDRTIVFPGFADATSSSRNGNGYHLFGQIGYASQMAGITLEPFVGLARDHLKLDALSETGGLAALDVNAVSRKLTTAQLGLKLSATADFGWAKFTPRTSIAWQHAVGDTTGRMTAGFQSGGLDYGIAGTALARNAAKVGLDFDFDIGAAKVIAGYTGTIGGVASEHTAKLAFQLKF